MESVSECSCILWIALGLVAVLSESGLTLLLVSSSALCFYLGEGELVSLIFSNLSIVCLSLPLIVLIIWSNYKQKTCRCCGCEDN